MWFSVLPSFDINTISIYTPFGDSSGVHCSCMDACLGEGGHSTFDLCVGFLCDLHYSVD